MTWIIPALLCALGYSLESAWQKGTLKDVHPRLLPFGLFAGGLPLVAILFALDPGPHTIKPTFWKPFAAQIALNFVAYTLYVRAIRISPLSLTVPFLAFTPIFMTVTAPLILGADDAATPAGLVGIVLVVAGAFWTNGGRLRLERGTVLILIVALIWSVAGALDKTCVEESSRNAYLLLGHAAFAVLFGLTLIPVRARVGPELRRAWPRLLVLGLLSASTLAFQMAAIVKTRAPYVIAIKRAGLLGSILIGCLVFKEGSLKERLPGGILMVAGCALVLLSG